MFWSYYRGYGQSGHSGHGRNVRGANSLNLSGMDIPDNLVELEAEGYYRVAAAGMSGAQNPSVYSVHMHGHSGRGRNVRNRGTSTHGTWYGIT